MRIGNVLIADTMMLVSAEKEPLYSELEKFVRILYTIFSKCLNNGKNKIE